jgi:signal transduction histidine kinase
MAFRQNLGSRESSLGLERARSKSLVFVFSLGSICLLGMVDWFTGPEIALSVAYLAPIAVAASMGARWMGLLMAGLSGAIWLFVELGTHLSYSQPWIPIWNGGVRLLIFCLVAVLVSEVVDRKRAEGALRRARDELEQRVRERTAELEALNQTLEQRVSERSAAAEERAQKLVLSEAALERQRGILQSILDSMGEGVVVTDRQGKLILINPSGEQLLGMTSPPTRELVWREIYERVISKPSRIAARPDGLEPPSGGRTEILLNRQSSPEPTCLLVDRRPWQTTAGDIQGDVIVFADISSLRTLERQIAGVSDREQQRLGQDLHDGLCQQLVSLSFAASLLADKLKERFQPEASDAAKIAKLLNESISQARDIARGLYLVQLEAGGLASALEELTEQASAQHQVRCDFIDLTESPMMDSPGLTDLFRIAQEAVINAVRHAKARRITVTLCAAGQEVRIVVEDDGQGMPPAGVAGRGMGLHIMHYRARMIGAQCQIEPVPTGGTRVTCSWTPAQTAQPLLHGNPA